MSHQDVMRKGDITLTCCIAKWPVHPIAAATHGASRLVQIVHADQLGQRMQFSIAYPLNYPYRGKPISSREKLGTGDL